MGGPAGSKEIERDRNLEIERDRTFLSLPSIHFASPKRYLFLSAIVSPCPVISISSYRSVCPCVWYYLSLPIPQSIPISGNIYLFLSLSLSLCLVISISFYLLVYLCLEKILVPFYPQIYLSAWNLYLFISLSLSPC